MAPMNPAGASPLPARACSQSSVVITLPISTVNMTGFRIMDRGSSLANASSTARW